MDCVGIWWMDLVVNAEGTILAKGVRKRKSVHQCLVLMAVHAQQKRTTLIFLVNVCSATQENNAKLTIFVMKISAATTQLAFQILRDIFVNVPQLIMGYIVNM
jgi:hypothetical protein